jgi:spermidine synthase
MRSGSSRCLLLFAMLLGGCTSADPTGVAGSTGPRGPSFVEGETQLLETVSAYSRMRITQEKSLRTLWFVEDGGREVRETAVDLEKPQELVIPYTRAMFVSHLLLARPPQRCLLVGLGGGAMVQFLDRQFPGTEVDAVEIDPVVVRIADEWFGTRPSPRIRITTQDGFVFVKQALAEGKRWDVIYMDAYLKPAEDTDSRGQQLRLKTLRFLTDVGRLLRKRGLVVFNVLRDPELDGYVRTIQRVFPHVRLITGYGRNVVVAASFTAPPSDAELERRARALDERDTGFSFVRLARTLRR